MKALYKNAIVEKRNILNETRNSTMTLQENRLFCAYLAKTNPWDITTRCVTFPLSEYIELLDIKKINIQSLKETMKHLLGQTVEVPTTNGGFEIFQIFKKCRLDKNEDGEWYVSFDAHDDALPLLFDYKDKYMKYKLESIMKLKSKIQIRMYEILKQYETIGSRNLSIEELCSLLGTNPECLSWRDFKRGVLDSCQKVLSEHTDICFTYERGKTGRGGKWLSIVFKIFKNPKYKNPKVIECECVDKPAIEIKNEDLDYGSELADLLASVCDYEFNPEQIRVIQDLVLAATGSHEYMVLADYLLHKYHIMNCYENDEPIKNRFTYLQSVIKNDIEEGVRL